MHCLSSHSRTNIVLEYLDFHFYFLNSICIIDNNTNFDFHVLLVPQT